jgi:hypothetical protein
LADFTTPEILRTPLDALCLQIKVLRLGDVRAFLAQAIEPPPEASIASALRSLMELDAVDAQDELTPLGHHLAELPVDARLGKMMLYGAMFSCLDPILTIAAGVGFRSPFMAPMDKREEADDARRKLAGPGATSDHLTLVRAYAGWVRAKARGRGFERDFLAKTFLSAQTLRQISEMRQQYVELLDQIGFLRSGTGLLGSVEVDEDEGGQVVDGSDVNVTAATAPAAPVPSPAAAAADNAAAVTATGMTQLEDEGVLNVGSATADVNPTAAIPVIAAAATTAATAAAISAAVMPCAETKPVASKPNAGAKPFIPRPKQQSLPSSSSHSPATAPAETPDPTVGGKALPKPRGSQARGLNSLQAHGHSPHQAFGHPQAQGQSQGQSQSRSQGRVQGQSQSQGQLQGTLQGQGQSQGASQSRLQGQGQSQGRLQGHDRAGVPSPSLAGGGKAGKRASRAAAAESALVAASVNASNEPLVRAVICAGLFPNVAVTEARHGAGSKPGGYGAANRVTVRTRGDGEVSLHPTSICFGLPSFEHRFLLYHEKVRTTKVYIRDATMVGAYPLLLFGGKVKVDPASTLNLNLNPKPSPLNHLETQNPQSLDPKP